MFNDKSNTGRDGVGRNQNFKLSQEPENILPREVDTVGMCL